MVCFTFMPLKCLPIEYRCVLLLSKLVTVSILGCINQERILVILSCLQACILGSIPRIYEHLGLITALQYSVVKYFEACSIICSAVYLITTVILSPVDSEKYTLSVSGTVSSSSSLAKTILETCFARYLPACQEKQLSKLRSSHLLSSMPSYSKATIILTPPCSTLKTSAERIVS